MVIAMYLIDMKQNINKGETTMKIKDLREQLSRRHDKLMSFSMTENMFTEPERMIFRTMAREVDLVIDSIDSNNAKLLNKVFHGGH